MLCGLGLGGIYWWRRGWAQVGILEKRVRDERERCPLTGVAARFFRFEDSKWWGRMYGGCAGTDEEAEEAGERVAE